MFISLFLAVITPIVFGAAWIGELYYRELDWQETQIILDNTAIRLGQNDLETVQRIEQDRKTIKLLHPKFHQSLACSLVPATAIGCGKLAKTLRATIRGINHASGVKAKLGWERGTAIVDHEINKSPQKFMLERTTELVLRQARCSVCGEVEGLILTNLEQAKSRLFEMDKRGLSTSVSLVSEGASRWNYRLWAK
ncbi:MAG: hypothetical protein EBQ92_08820 [Proteobacteria bacterium]|nr:hypothetical protein [Pseudomonadota bacterium]